MRLLSPSARRGGRRRWLPILGQALALSWVVTALPAAARATEQTVLEFKFDEGTGVSTRDSGPDHLVGQISGATWTSGYSGQALEFHGGTQFEKRDVVTVVGSASLDFSPPFSVEAWILSTGRESYQCIVDKHEHLGGPAAGFSLYLTQGQLRLSLYGGLDGDADVIGTSDLRDNEWHHVKGRWDGKRLVVEVDSQQEGEAVWDAVPQVSASNVSVGQRGGGWGGYMPFQGVIDEVAIRCDGPSPGSGYSAFAKLDDFSGDVRDPLHRGWVGLLGFTSGIVRPIGSGSGGTAAGKASSLPFEGRKLLDRASVPLAQACAQGRRLRDVTVELTQKPPNKTRFYKLKLFDVFVTGVAVEGDSASEWAKPVEHFTLNCGRLEWTYTEVDNGGRRLADIEADWDEATGQAGQRSSPLPPDTDSDGIPDEAELAMGLRVTEDDAAQDYDQDGLNNYQEFLAGTQPWNPDSVLKVTGILAVLDGELRASLTWNSTAGRVYDILASDWPAGPYRRVASVAATGETTSHVLAGPMNRRFFLLQLQEE